MSSAMKHEGTERRKSHAPDDRRSGVVRAAPKKSVEPPAIAASMVDALEDILKWERASERALHVAADTSSRDVASVS